MIDKKIIIAPINVETAPNYVLRKAFENNFKTVIEYDWYKNYQSNGASNTWEKLASLIFNEKPDYLWMQIQNPNALSPKVVAELSNYVSIINWTGDVRHSSDWLNWYNEIGKHCLITLFSSEEQANLLSNKIRTGYLQIGFDNIMYAKTAKSHYVKNPDIVFFANNYFNMFPLSEYRRQAVYALKEEFGDNFRVFGVNWGGNITVGTNAQEAYYYTNAKIAISISHYNYERYFSDRLIRILGCGGAIALSHNYKGIEKDFIVGKELDAFSDIDTLINKCKYYLENEDKRAFIAQNGMAKAHNYCTWDYRVKELILLLNNQ